MPHKSSKSTVAGQGSSQRCCHIAQRSTLTNNTSCACITNSSIACACTAKQTCPERHIHSQLLAARLQPPAGCCKTLEHTPPTHSYTRCAHSLLFSRLYAALDSTSICKPRWVYHCVCAACSSNIPKRPRVKALTATSHHQHPI